MMKKHIVMLLLAAALSASAQSPVKVNQIGYYPDGPKVAVIEPAAKAKSFTLKDSHGKTVWSGKAARQSVSPFDGRQRQVVDFTSVRRPGTYTLTAKGKKQQVIIAPNAYKSVAEASVKAFYLQRTGMAIDKQYAGAYARPAAHMDREVIVHPSAASPQRPAGTVISSPEGWYDAGDYNKYIVNSGFTCGLMLENYLINKAYYDRMSLNIPESGNSIPDYLDEIMYNLRWMLTMQDPADGGVYHKLTTPSFEGFVMPAECRQPRYVVQKGTAAALDFAATMALAARVYAPYAECGEFCKNARKAAARAFAWAVAHPDVAYDQDKINKQYKPEIVTGAYGDGRFSDEFFWAATELYLTTGEEGYLLQATALMPERFTVPTWGDVSGIGAMAWLNLDINGSKPAGAPCTEQLKKSLKAYCDSVVNAIPTSAFGTPNGNRAEDFCWGSNSERCAGMGIALMYEYALSGDKSYLTAAMATTDYLFGRNATGYCYVTGFGTQQVMNIHHRISTADGVKAPLPGLLAGGPNIGQQDRNENFTYHSNIPDESYEDAVQSYASNEIAINWNAYLAVLTAWIDAVAK
ncbi:MAG: glycoside hydrolase family 9 protein [Prevotella sp.]